MTTSSQRPPWRVVIADDEPPAVATLRLLLSRHQSFNVVAECGHGQQAIDAVGASTPDVLFLDVQMPGLDGFDVLRAVGPTAVPAVVFVTAYDRYALRAFESHALDYLLKPFSDERFSDVLTHVEARLRERSHAATGRRLARLLAAGRPSSEDGCLIVRDAGRTRVIPHDDIVWIEAEDYYARVHSRDRRVLVRMPLKHLAAMLTGDRFVRIHRSALVNVQRVREVAPLSSGDQRLVLDDGTALRVSRTCRSALNQALQKKRLR